LQVSFSQKNHEEFVEILLLTLDKVLVVAFVAKSFFTN